MAFTHKITRSYRDSSSSNIGGVETVTGDSESTFSGTAAANTSTEIDIAITRANLKSVFFLADIDIELGAEFATPLDVDDTTNVSGGDADITTATPHALTVSQKVRITGIVGSTNLNGTWYVKSISSSTKFKISATSGGGAVQGNDATYVSDGLVYTQDVISLVSGIGVVWSLATDGLGKCPMTADVGKFWAKNVDADTAAAVQIRALTDQTP